MATKNEKDLKAIKKVRAEEAEKIQKIFDRVAEEDRQMDKDERAEVGDLTKGLNDLERQQEEAEANIALEKKVKEASDGIIAPDPTPPESPSITNIKEPVKSIGEQFVQSKAYQDVFGGGSGIPQGEWSTGVVELSTKSTVVSGGTISGAGPYQQYVPGIIPIGDQPLVVADLMPNNTATAPQIQFFKERVATNAAAGVAEAAQKPISTFDFQADSASLAKIATFLPVSDEMLEDAPAIQNYLNNRLAMFVRTEEEQQLLRGAGSGSNEVEGFIDNYALNGVGTAAASGAPGTASFGDIVTIMNNQRGSSYLDPDALIMHPTQFGSILSAYDANEQYYAGGPLSPGLYGGGRNVNSSRFSGWTFWQVPVHITTQVGQGTMLLGNFSQGAAVWRRGGISVQASNSHGDFFRTNLTAIRAEERVALTVYRPEAFTVINWN